MTRTQTRRGLTKAPRTPQAKTLSLSYYASRVKAAVKTSTRAVAQYGDTSHRLAAHAMLTERDIVRTAYNLQL
jgi:hypothetical protein